MNKKFFYCSPQVATWLEQQEVANGEVTVLQHLLALDSSVAVERCGQGRVLVIPDNEAGDTVLEDNFQNTHAHREIIAPQAIVLLPIPSWVMDSDGLEHDLISRWMFKSEALELLEKYRAELCV